MAKSILRSLRKAQEQVLAEISDNGARGGMYASGLASEGYAGGYLAALADVEAMLTHGFPSDTRGYWRQALTGDPA